MSFKRKIVAILVLVGLLPVLTSALIMTILSTTSLKESTFEHLSSVRETKSEIIHLYLDSLINEIEVLALSPEVGSAIPRFSEAFEGASLHDSQSERKALKQFYLSEFLPRWQENRDVGNSDVEPLVSNLSRHAAHFQYEYIVTNPNPVGQKDSLEKGASGDEYSIVHQQYHSYFRAIQQSFSFYDVFLVDQSGTIVYSVFKELDFATSLVNGPYSDSGLAQAFVKASMLGPDEVAVTDFSLYIPSYSAPAGFISAPVFSEGKRVGVLIAQFPIDELNAVMANREGLGETGEVYLVGPDNLMRSDSYLDPVNHSVSASFLHPENGRVETDAVQRAQSGKINTDIIIDYNDNPVLSAYAPFEFAGLGWVILAEIDEAEALAPQKEMISVASIILGTALITSIIAAWAVTKMVIKPLGAEPKVMQELAQRIAAGDLTVATNVEDTSSVHGAMSKMSVTLRELIQQIHARAHTQSGTAQELAAISEQTTAAIQEQHANTTQIATAVSQMSTSAHEVSHTIQNVALAMSDAKDTVNKSANDVMSASSALHKVSEELQLSDQKVDELAHEVDSISIVLESIQGISDQTNLLALNAAIEAARAGESGRGFAVVADEVRTLAQNTQKETEQISSIIANLQQGASEAQNLMKRSVKASEQVATHTNGTVQQLRDAVSKVEHVDEMTIQISSAAEEQSSVAAEISQNIETLSVNSQQTEQAINNIAQTSEEVANLSTHLRSIVDRFKI